MYTIHEQRPEYKEFLIQGYIPTQDQHQRLAEQFITGGYDSLVYQPGDLRTTPKSSVDFLELYNGLKKLSISCCNIIDIHAIAECQPGIEDLGFGGSSSKKNLSFLRSMKHLSRFGIHGLSSNIDAISSLSKLVSLHISAIDAEAIEFRNLKELSYLYVLHNCKNIEKTDISDLTNLRGLSFTFVRNLEDFNFLSSLQNLVGASFVWVPKLSKIPDLSNLHQLKTLEFDTCSRITNLDFIKSNRSIENLLALGCNITPSSLEAINKHPSLQKAYIAFSSKRKQQEAAKILEDKLVPVSQQLFHYTISPTSVIRMDRA